jgi:hypothetical protein
MAANMLVKMALVAATAIATLGGCTGDDDGGGGGGGDTLPKRGERATDPTIVSAAASCAACGGTICTGSDPANSHVRVRVDASDPMGAANLGTCAGTLAGIMDQGAHGDGGGSSCYLHFKLACMPGQVHTVALTVSNATGGVTTASVKLTVAP